jgi:hypothetical protein
MASKYSKSEIECLKMLYQRNCEEWRHFDTMIWQVTNIAFVVNGFLVFQAFNMNLDLKIRIVIPIIASMFTLVFLIALIKHRLHQDAKSWNIREIEKELIDNEANRTKFFSFTDTKDFAQLKEFPEKKPSFFIVLFKNAKAFNWLCWLMSLTIVIDIFLAIGIIFAWWN